MEKKETVNTIVHQLESIYRKVFDARDLQISEELTADDVDEWDSLTYIAMISEVEKSFEIKIAFMEMIGFQKTGDLIECIFKKLDKKS